MKARNLTVLAIGTTAALALAAFAFVTGLERFSETDNGGLSAAIGLTLLAFVVWYFVHNIVHELFHAVFCAAFFGKVTAIAFCGFEFSFVTGRKKIKFSPRSAYAGYTEFVCKKPEKTLTTLTASLIGGLVGTLAVLALIVVLYFANETFFTTYFVFMGIVPVFYMFLLNFACDFGGSDGRLLFSGKEGVERIAETMARLEKESYLYQGKTLKEAYPVNTVRDFKKPERSDAYEYYLYLQTGNIEAAKAVLEEILNDDENIDNGVIDGYSERLFIACIQKDEAVFSTYPKDIASKLPDDEPDGLRVHCAYRRYVGDDEWAELLKNSYFKACDKMFVKGLAETYREIGERLL